MFVDFIHNGQASGPVAEALMSTRFDPGYLRPMVYEDGKKYVTINTGKFKTNENGIQVPVYEVVPLTEIRYNRGIDHPVYNATTLRKDEWIQMDRAVLMATRQRLRAWADIASRVPFGGFNGMGRTILEYEAMNDPGEAIVDMDGLTDGRTDTPKYQLEGLPLPITHSDFYFSSRQLAVSRNSGTPLDTTMVEACTRRIVEMVEKMTIGTVTGPTYGASGDYSRTSAVYGYLNYPSRQTYTSVTTPTGANPNATVDDVLAMRDLAYDAGFYGPFMLYHSNDWDQYMDNDYAFTNSTGWATSPNQTLRGRLRQIEGIQDVRRLDYLTSSSNPFTLLLVQMTSDVVRAVNGMDIRTVQWESKGGMQVNFKIMCIYVPHIRSDYNGNCGVIHGTTS